MVFLNSRQTNRFFIGLTDLEDDAEIEAKMNQEKCVYDLSITVAGSGRSSGEGTGIPLQYSCLENPMDKGAWWAAVHGVTQSWT